MSKFWTRVYLLVSIFLNTQIASASQYQNLNDLSGDLRALANRVSQSTFGLQTKNINSLQGTAFFVGEGGEAFTNLHVVEQCLIEAHATREELAYSKPVFTDPKNPSSQHFLKKMLIAIDPKHPITCKSKIFFNGAQIEADIQVLHVFGPGFLYPKNLIADLTRLDLAARNTLINLGFEGAGDLVLIKAPLLKNSSCLKIATAKFSSEAPWILNVAYTEVLRETGDAKNPYKLIGDGRKNPIVSFGNGTSAGDLLKLDEPLYSAIVPSGTLLASTDAEIGSSGSPLVNEKGEVVAVVRATYNPPSSRYEAWTTHAIDLSHHSSALQRLRASLTICQ
jgi:Trypsin-like peptidase domain